MRTLSQWLSLKWTRELQPNLAESYRVAFGTDHGQRVLRHLLDEIYCRCYEGRDPIEAAHHNGRRSVVQEILENIDLAESPRKYQTPVETEGVYARPR